MEHELWRKVRLSGAEGLDQGEVGRERVGEGGGMEVWAERTQETINSLRNGKTVAGNS